MYKIILYMLSFISLMKYFHQINPYLYLNREPILKKFCLALLPLTGPFSRKKAWCSMAHFHRCLAAFSLCRRKTKVCSCSWPWSSSSTTTNFSFFPWKSSLVIFGLQWTHIIFIIPLSVMKWLVMNIHFETEPASWQKNFKKIRD